MVEERGLSIGDIKTLYPKASFQQFFIVPLFIIYKNMCRIIA